MTIEHVGLVLAKAALYDPHFREPDVNIARAWDEALGEFDVQAALDAVKDHYQSETRTLMPADVLKRLRPASRSLPANRPMREVLAEIEAKVAADNAGSVKAIG